MSSSIEERIARLESSRYRVVGQLNAHRAVLLSAWMTLIARGSAPAIVVINQMRAALLTNQKLRAFPGLDAVELEAYSQEYDSAIATLLTDLEAAVVSPAKGI